MRTSDIFVTTAEKLNESIEKVFGKKLNLESFDLPKLQDARNKLRTQLSQVRSESSFNETLENEAYTEAQWMLDAINAEIAERAEFVVGPVQNEGGKDEIARELGQIANEEDYDKLYDLLSDSGPVGKYLQGQIEDITAETGLHPKDDFERIEQMLMDRIQDEFADYGSGYDGDREDPHGYDDTDDSYALASAGHGSDEDYESFEVEDSTDPADKGEYDREGDMAQDDLTTAEEAAEELKSILDADENLPEWVQAKITKAVDYLDTARDYMKSNESINTGDNMRKLNEGEIQQASAIVTAKTMVDRVGRWIEELSGMENDTLLTLGDSIRDEMGAEQAKNFISACAPAIQQALQNLKDTREALSSSVRALTGEEQGAEMLGGEPAGDEMGGEMGGDEFGGEAEPDAMNPEAGAEDEFAAAEPAAGGMNDAGREKRESIDYSNRLLKVLAG